MTDGLWPEPPRSLLAGAFEDATAEGPSVFLLVGENAFRDPDGALRDRYGTLLYTAAEAARLPKFTLTIPPPGADDE